MRKWMIIKGIKIGLFMVVAGLAFGGVLMLAWNWVIPGLFGLPELGLMQAIVILLITRMLFGGWSKGHNWGGGHWRSRMKDKMAGMSPEEREKFRSMCYGKYSHRKGWGGSEEVEAKPEVS